MMVNFNLILDELKLITKYGSLDDKGMSKKF